MNPLAADPNWETLVAALPVTITVLDRSFRVIQQFNAENTRLQTAPGDTFLAESRQYLRTVRDAHQAVRFEAATDDDPALCYEHHARLLPDEQSIVVTSLDVTAHKQREAELRQVKRRFDAILENSSDAIAISTLGDRYDDSSFILGNWRMEEMLGYSLDEFKHMRPSQLLVRGMHPTADERYRKRQQSRGQGVLEGVAQRKDGTTFPFESMAIPILNDDGHAAEQVNFVRDITERKQREQELLDARIQAETALKARDVFIANMSHELRSPLNTIQGHVQLLLEQTGISTAFVQHLQAIDYSSEHLSRLIGDVLELSRIEAGFDSLHPTMFNPRSLCERLYGMLAIQAQRKRLALEFEIAADFPQQIRMDEVKLKQVLINLVDNAIKYTQRGTVKVQASATDAHALRCTITDTGSGISAQDMARLLQPFERGDKVQAAAEGSGLGLSISKRLVDLLGGRIAIYSSPAGTTVTVELPYEPIISQPEAPPEAMPIIPTAGEFSVLVVDDQPMDRQVLVSFLERRGFNVETADHGFAALRMVAANMPDVIFMDLRMPGMDGAETVRRLRESAGRVGERRGAIIALTGDVIPENEQRLLEAGCDAVVFKPYRLPRILELLIEHLDLSVERGTGASLSSPQTSHLTSITTDDLAGLPEAWLREMYIIGITASHKEALAQLRLIEGDHPQLAQSLLALVKQFWTARIADLIAPLLERDAK